MANLDARVTIHMAVASTASSLERMGASTGWDIQAGIESEWVDWMNKVHFPNVLRTGCFAECRFYKVLGSEGDELTYVLQYRCR
jgi:hypothetical protein